ncbi:MAG: ribbon-helix-helix domain-containing protein [Rhodospirillales bacterium]
MEKRSFVLSGHATSVALEPDFWAVLEDVAARRSMSMAALVEAVDGERETANLASALRCFALGEAVAGRVGT